MCCLLGMDEAADKVQVKMEAESPEDVAATAAALALPAAAAAATGRRLRPLPGFARALLAIHGSYILHH